MLRIWCATSLTALVLLAALHATAFEPPAVPTKVRIEPIYADRLFPYIKYGTVWQGTPAQRDDVAIPAVSIAYGQAEASRIVAEAAKLAFYLGLWCEDIGFGVKNVMEKGMPRLMIMDADLQKSRGSNVIVVGTNNTLTSVKGIRFGGPSVLYKEAEGVRFLFVGGATEKETLDAIDYLSDVRLNFKAGAYRTFFNLVRLRGYVAAKNWEAALETIESPEGLSACGRNMALASPMMAEAPEKVREHVRHRNQILYGLLPNAVKERDKDRALNLWRDAMKTCYGCHQGAGGIPRLRPFVPTEAIHAKHQRIAERFEAQGNCQACHFGETSLHGYE